MPEFTAERIAELRKLTKTAFQNGFPSHADLLNVAGRLNEALDEIEVLTAANRLTSRCNTCPVETACGAEPTSCSDLCLEHLRAHPEALAELRKS